LEKCLTPTVIYRSSWELTFCKWCDECEEVLMWASEPIGIKYLNPVKNMDYCLKYGLNPNDPHNWKEATYYVDFWIEVKDDSMPDGKKRIFVEVKPNAESVMPPALSESASLKDRKKYNKLAKAYLENQAKWASAKKYVEERGAFFTVITEKTINKLRGGGIV